MRYLDPQRHSRQPRGARGHAGRGGRLRCACSCSAISSATAPIRMRSSSACARCPTPTIIRGNHDKVGAGLESVESFNHLARQAIEWTATTLTPENRAWLAALPQGPVVDRRPRRDLPRLAVRRGRLHLRRPRRAPRARAHASGRSACSATRTCRRSSGSTASSTLASGRRAAPRFRLTLDAEGEVSGELRRRRPAARRRPARGVRHPRHRRAHADGACAWPTTSPPRRPRSSRRACRRCSRSAGDRTLISWQRSATKSRLHAIS